MYEINKETFGAFVASRRRALGLTQAELAEKVAVSNKAVSKWETGVSLPDVAILIPLAEVLGVSVTELLEGRRIEPETPLDTGRVEELVQTVIRYPEIDRFAEGKRKRAVVYWVCILISAVEAAALHFFGFPVGSWTSILQSTYAVGIIFGAYFMIFVQPLPPYHDQYQIRGMYHGPVRMNVPGLYFNNRNWPHIVRAGQIWSMCCLVGYPVLFAVLYAVMPVLWIRIETVAVTPVLILGLFVPMYVVGKKYE